jgi:transglutaminase-like putative cysteine protease
MKYRVSHTTLYEYAHPVGLCYNEIRLVPRQLPGRQQCESFSLQIDPRPEDYRERRDFFGNLVAFFYLQEQHTRLQVSALSEVQIDTDQQRFSFAEKSPWEEVLNRLRDERSFAALDALQYAYDSPLAAGAGELGDYARASYVSGRSLFEATRELMQRIHADFTFDPHFTTLATPLKNPGR